MRTIVFAIRFASTFVFLRAESDEPVPRILAHCRGWMPVSIGDTYFKRAANI